MTAPQQARIKTVQHEEASRLPDTSWMWRRILIYAVCGVCLLIAWRVSERVTDVVTLRQINRYTYGLLALSLMLYGVGATVTDVAKLVTAFLSTKKTTETTAPPSATVSQSADGGSRIETTDGELPASERIP